MVEIMYKRNCKSFRLKAYKYALEEIENDTTNLSFRIGICHCLSRYKNMYLIDGKNISIMSLDRHFPELYKYRPNRLTKNGYYWANNNKIKRIKVLKEIISDMSK